MKNILSVFFLLISVSCYSMIDSDTIKIFPEINGIIKYEGVVNVDSAITKEQLFVNAKNWFVDTYKSANDVIQMQDKDAGIIIGKGDFSVVYSYFMSAKEVTIYHTIKISAKDGKYKYEIYDFNAKYYSPGNTIGNAYISGQEVEFAITNNEKGPGKKARIKMDEDINIQVLDIIQSLKKYMNVSVSIKDNW